MKYGESLQTGAAPTEIQAFLVEGETAPVATRITSNYRDAVKESAAPSGVNCTSFVEPCIIEKLSK